MVKNLIIKNSYSKLQDGKLKSNLGDLIRSTVLINCIEGDFLWLTDSRSKDLLKCFVESKKIFTYEDIETNKSIFSAQEIYNLDNYVPDEKMFNNLHGNWNGYIWDGKKIFPKNIQIKSIEPYDLIDIGKSWQQALVEGMGFVWEKQDYAKSNLEKISSADIGLNWDVYPTWTSKHWSKENWKELEELLIKKRYSVSWQKGLNNLDEYILWLNSCEKIITCDTLGLHLASALRKKVVALVGPTENNEYPYNRIAFIKPPSRDCMPCNSPICKFGETCLNEITPETVVEYISADKSMINTLNV